MKFESMIISQSFYLKNCIKLKFNFDKTPLQIAIDKGNIEIFKILLQREDINVNAQTIYNTIIF